MHGIITPNSNLFRCMVQKSRLEYDVLIVDVPPIRCKLEQRLCLQLNQKRLVRPSIRPVWNACMNCWPNINWKYKLISRCKIRRRFDPCFAPNIKRLSIYAAQMHVQPMLQPTYIWITCMHYIHTMSKLINQNQAASNTITALEPSSKSRNKARDGCPQPAKAPGYHHVNPTPDKGNPTTPTMTQAQNKQTQRHQHKLNPSANF